MIDAVNKNSPITKRSSNFTFPENFLHDSTDAENANSL
jgi:hypothetical protein